MSILVCGFNQGSVPFVEKYTTAIDNLIIVRAIQHSRHNDRVESLYRMRNHGLPPRPHMSQSLADKTLR